MCIGAAGAGLAQDLGDLEREIVLPRRVAAVQHFDAVHELKDRETRRFLGCEIERFFPLTTEVNRVKEMSERVSDD